MTQKPNKNDLRSSLPKARGFPGFAEKREANASQTTKPAFARLIFFQKIFCFATLFFGWEGPSKLFGQVEAAADKSSSGAGALISIPKPRDQIRNAIEAFPPQLPPTLPTSGANASSSIGSSSNPPTTNTSLPTSLDPNQLVLRAVQQAVWGPSVYCRIRQSSLAGELRLVGEGEYWAAGQGSGQLKLTMQLAAGELQTNMVQVSDGRLVWTSTSDDEAPRRVYLDRIRSELGNMSRNPTEYPQAALYLAIGGHAEMLRCLYYRYRWFRVIAGKDENGVPVWQLIGTLRTEAPSIASYTVTDNYFIQAEPPVELPTDVRLILDRDGKYPLFPHKVEYFRREENTEDSPGKLVLVSTITHTDMLSPITITKDLFQYQVREDADRIEDETNDYLPTVPIADAGTLQRR